MAPLRRSRITSLADEEQRDLLGVADAEEDEAGDGADDPLARSHLPPLPGRHQDRATVAGIDATKMDAAAAAAPSSSGRRFGDASKSGDIVAKSALASGLFALFLSEVEAASVSRVVERLLAAPRSVHALRALARAAAGLLRPLFRGGAAMVLLQGPAGLGMAVIIAVAGIVAAVRAQLHAMGEAGSCCFKCDGWGATKCNLCGGRGEVMWEGKHYHCDPCPACFGAGFQKCDSCGGACNSRQGTPPFARQA